MFIADAFAQPAAGAAGATGGMLEMFLPLILIFVIFYFLLIRPQQKKMKQHRSMVNSVQKGDKILTSGGIYGTVTKVVNDQEVMVEIADNIEVRLAKVTISDVLNRSAAGAKPLTTDVPQASDVAKKKTTKKK